MSGMTVAHLGVVVFVMCLSTQVISQASDSPRNNTATSNATTMPTKPYSSPTNTTTATGAGVMLHAGTASVLIPVVVAACLLQRYC